MVAFLTLECANGQPAVKKEKVCLLFPFNAEGLAADSAGLAAASLLAAYHFNTGDTSVVPEGARGGVGIQLEPLVLDTQGTAGGGLAAEKECMCAARPALAPL